mmetsp:Transcript_10023/g.14179  ORF Transcript_10023/g.14179 Transcript_10023/m.14179 type:complete len:201 (+) Transcript_10023:79-681(+)
MQAMNRKKMSRWFVQFGKCEHNAMQIVNKRIFSPTKLATRRCTAFACGTLHNTLKDSIQLEITLASSDESGYKCDENKINDNEEEIQNELEDINKTNPLIDSTKYSLLQKLEVDVNDKVLIPLLLREIIQIQKEQNKTNHPGSNFMFENSLNPPKSTMFVEVPAGLQREISTIDLVIALNGNVPLTSLTIIPGCTMLLEV